MNTSIEISWTSPIKNGIKLSLEGFMCINLEIVNDRIRTMGGFGEEGVILLVLYQT